MKYKLSFLVFLLLFVGYIFLSLFNPGNARLYVAYGKYYETTTANYIAVAFVMGIVITLIAGIIGDLKRFLDGWRRRVSEKKKNAVKDLLEKAKLLEARGEEEKAEQCLNRAIKDYPAMEEPYLAMADMYVARMEFAKAEEVLEKAEAHVGKTEGVLFKRVALCRRRKDSVRVESGLKEILKINGTNIQAMKALRDVYIDRKTWNDALDIEKRLKKLRKIEDENQYMGIQYERAKALFEKNDERLYEQVLKDVREITHESKEFIPAYILKAEVYKKMERLNDAGRVYGRGFSKTGHIIFLQKMEDLYINRGEPGVILKIYERLMDVTPRNQLLLFLYARLCLRLEMIDEAIDLLNSLIAEEKEFKGLHRAMAEAYIHRGQLNNAVKEFVKAFPMTDVYVPFYCRKCRAAHHEWNDYCGSCHSWGTVSTMEEGFFQSEAEDLRLVYEQEGEVL